MKTIFKHKLLHKYLTRSIEATMVEFTGTYFIFFLIADFQQNTCLYHVYYSIVFSYHLTVHPSFGLEDWLNAAPFVTSALCFYPAQKPGLQVVRRNTRNSHVIQVGRDASFFVLLNLRIVRLPPGITRQQTCR